MRIIQRLVSADLHGSFHIGPSDGGSIALIHAAQHPVTGEPAAAAW